MTYSDVSLCFVCIVYIQSAKRVFCSLQLMLFFLFITAILANIIILSIIKNNENTDSACGYFTFHLYVLLPHVTQETQTGLC